MTTDRRVSATTALPRSPTAQLRARTPAMPSWFAALVFAAFVIALSWLSVNWALAIYGLSFWHYALYFLAYAFGAVSAGEFRRDAVLWKTTALVALGTVYFATPLNLLSLFVVAGGFLLNSLAARALGAERTYYGYELMDLPPVKITAFPYSWIAHPMLVGNMAAFGGTLLNADFRRQWWPLAVAHIVLNLGLLIMELVITPQRRRVYQTASFQAHPHARHFKPSDLLIAVGAGVVAWISERSHPSIVSVIAASMAIYALALFRRYTAIPGAGTAQESRRSSFHRSIDHGETVPETIE